MRLSRVMQCCLGDLMLSTNVYVHKTQTFPLRAAFYIKPCTRFTVHVHVNHSVISTGGVSSTGFFLASMSCFNHLVSSAEIKALHQWKTGLK